jgi:hypothetical protein
MQRTGDKTRYHGLFMVGSAEQARVEHCSAPLRDPLPVAIVLPPGGLIAGDIFQESSIYEVGGAFVRVAIADEFGDGDGGERLFE